MEEPKQYFNKPALKSRIDPDLSDSVGARLQALRKKFGLSQRELARRADVTNSTLSMIEQGKVSPSVGSLEKILFAFPISLQEFFSASLELNPAVVDAAEFIQVRRDNADFRILPLSMGAQKDNVCLAEQTYLPGARINSEWMTQRGFVGGFVLQGKLELHLDGVKYYLASGDGFNFSLQRDHTFVNTGDDICKVVSVSNR